MCVEWVILTDACLLTKIVHAQLSYDRSTSPRHHVDGGECGSGCRLRDRAFTNLTATRDANIQVAGDASSYLALQPALGPNGAYASLRGGKLHVSLTGAIDGEGKGVNRATQTIVRNIFTITNQGSQPVDIWLTDASERVTFRTNGTAIERRDQTVTVTPGETLAVGLTVDTRQLTGDIDLQTMTIHAQSEVGDAGNADGTTATAPTGSH
jgi:hypothetical protein